MFPDFNGCDPAHGKADNFIAEEVAQPGKQINIGLIIPCRYEMFEFNMISPGHLRKLLRESVSPIVC